VAAAAFSEVGIHTEGALAVVASNAVLRARTDQMLHRQCGTDLSRLRQSASAHIVTTVATQTLTRAVIGMAKT